MTRVCVCRVCHARLEVRDPDARPDAWWQAPPGWAHVVYLGSMIAYVCDQAACGVAALASLGAYVRMGVQP